MAAAYAALVSLLNTLDQIQIHPLLSTTFNNYPIKSLREKIDLFLDFVEKSSDEEAEDLVRRIAVVAHEAENIIEVHASRVVKFGKRKRIVAHRNLRIQTTNFLSSLQRIMDGMDCIKEQIIMIQEGTGNHHHHLLLHLARYIPCLLPLASCLLAFLLPPALEANEENGSIINQQPTYSSSSSAKTTTNMVGFDGYLEQLLDRLTRQRSGGRQILPIVGMGGIGKTTLARNVYDNSLIVEHFYVRVWVTVSQQFTVREILLQALSCLGRSTNETNRTYGQLGEELYKILYGRRYLIVLDDVWSVEDWEKLKFFFPENNNASGIVITTRQSELVRYFGSSALALDFLDDENSWVLLCEKTFPQHDCPPELVEIGKKIAVKCKGLPLAIVVVGGLLGKSRTTREWEKIAEDKSLIHERGQQCLRHTVFELQAHACLVEIMFSLLWIISRRLSY